MFFKLCVVVFFCLICPGILYADTPANCRYSDVEGEWWFYETERNQTNAIDCNPSQLTDPVSHKALIKLVFPDIVFDHFGNEGHWTYISNQGFEATVNGRKYFAFALSEKTNGTMLSYCQRTSLGWSHDVLARNWACFYGRKNLKPGEAEIIRKSNGQQVKSPELFLNQNTEEYVVSINDAQSDWTATTYPDFEALTYQDFLAMNGGPNSAFIEYPEIKHKENHKAKEKSDNYLPSHWDWRDVDGVNYVSPVRNQAKCGSCYAFAVTAMLEARIRIVTNNTQQPILSTQDVVSCCPYSQGCGGGYTYLSGGTYPKDFGFVEEHCNPYIGNDTDTCMTVTTCKRYYVSDYSYLGGYYGGCNEQIMKEKLVKNGPIAVSYLAGRSLMQYESGIYRDVTHMDTHKFEPYLPTNHAVLIVGYGTSKTTGTNYWIVKNSWGDKWGEKGYFKIRRGTNERAIESFAFEATPIPA